MSLAWPWILATLALALSGLTMALWLAQRRPANSGKLPTEWPLAARPVFSSDERRTYRHLRQALPGYMLLAKLPLVRFCQPSDPEMVRQWYRLLGSAQVAFAVCTPQGRVLLAVDLESQRKPSPRGERALEIKRRALAACDIAYERWQADRLPSPSALIESLPPLPGIHPASQGQGKGEAPQHDPGFSVQSIWRDSGQFRSSTFDTELSAFGLPALGRAEARGNPDDIVGIVVDTPPAALRH